MKKLLLVFIYFPIVNLTSFAQAPAIQWQKALGGTGFENTSSIQQTTDGGYVASGYSQSTNGDVTENKGGTDLWVVKVSNAGDIQWQKSFGGSEADYSNQIQQTLDGGYIMTGSTNSTDGDVSGNHGSYDVWVVKLSSSGDLQWQKSLGGSGTDYGYSIQQTTIGDYFITGSTNSNNGDVIGNHGSQDVWIVKLSITGDLHWQKTLGGTNGDQAYTIKPTSDGGCVLAGYSTSNDGDVTVNHGNKDVWIVKLNDMGSIQWQKSFGGTDEDGANSIQQTADNGYIVAGYTKSSNGDIISNHGNFDFWILKLSNSGGLEWQKTYGGLGDDLANCIQQTTDGGYIVTGYSSSTEGDISANYGNNDFWVIKLSNTGYLEWQKTLGGSNNDMANSIQQTSDGGYVVSGYTFSNDDDVATNHGDNDGWIVKLAPDPLARSIFTSNSFTLYPNPAQKTLQLQTNTTIDKIIITDLSGKIILEQRQNTNQVNIEQLSVGMYFIEVFSGDEKFTSKFMKK